MHVSMVVPYQFNLSFLNNNLLDKSRDKSTFKWVSSLVATPGRAVYVEIQEWEAARKIFKNGQKTLNSSLSPYMRYMFKRVA